MTGEDDGVDPGSCLSCLGLIALLFIITFVFGHWNQLQDRLAHVLGLT